MNPKNYLDNLKSRAGKENTPEQFLAKRVEKELGVPFKETFFGCLVGSRKIGLRGVETALSEAKESGGARLFRYLVGKQKAETWK